MERDQSTPLFSLSIDPLTKAHFTETARWARILAYIGFALLLVMLVGGIFISTAFANSMANADPELGSMANFPSAMGIGMALVYLVFAVISFFPLLYLLRFANNMKTALSSNDQQALNVSIQNLKICFRYVGILTILTVAFYVVWIILIVSQLALMS